MANWFILLLGALKEGSKAYYTWLESAEKRKYDACVEAAEKYIQVNEKEGIFKDLPDYKKERFLKHFKKRFWKYN